MNAKKITIKKATLYNEYRVPAPDGSEAGAYYTDHKGDAIATARAMHGVDVEITFRSVTTAPTQHFVIDEARSTQKTRVFMCGKQTIKLTSKR